MDTYRVIVEFEDGSSHEFETEAESEDEAYANAMPTSLLVIKKD